MPPRLSSSLRILCVLCASAVSVFAQQRTRGPFPPKGDPIPPADRQSLEQSLKRLESEITTLQTTLHDKPHLLQHLPDIQIFHKSVAWPLQYDEPLDLKTAKRALEIALERAQQLKQHQTPWLTEGGIRAYTSKIDGSIQPYVVEMPKNFDPSHLISSVERAQPDNLKSEIKNSPSYRLDFFFHGRDERLTELKFILGKRPEAPTHPTDEKRILVYTYGRYCNANKFAGEIDTFEVLAAMKRDYPIDDDRVIITGFSMGGAAAWHHAVHYTDRFAAASPGAGFAETRVYQNMESTGEWAALPDWQKKLHHLYDCTAYAANLHMLPTIAYAGELDKQRQSGDLMEQAAVQEGLKLERVWGPKTEHKYEPAAKAEIAKRLDAYAAKGRNPLPTEIHFTTYTLRYNKMHWLKIDELGEHWKQARVRAALAAQDHIQISTSNVRALTIHIPADATSPITPNAKVAITINGQKLSATSDPDRSLRAKLFETERWQVSPDDRLILGKRPWPDLPPSKQHSLQGPIDDAFLDPFLIVKPSRPALNPTLEAWTKHELYHASTQWRAIFRGLPREKNDHELTDADIQNHNLILFGDPTSNATLARIADKLPIKWTRDHITLNNQTYPSTHHVPILIHPNPLNPTKYVVLNSGFTFRPPDHRTNSRQIPRLPDYAILDITQPPTPDSPGKVLTANFFTESWKLPPSQ